MKQFILFILIFNLLLSSTAFAQESDSSSSGRMATTIEYDLPYPGILPNSPVYPVKMFRDRIIGYLIADPLKKSEFLLLQSDKRLEAGVTLLLKNKSEAGLAVETISKGENYFSEAMDEAITARNQKKDIYDMVVKLSASARKHEEVLQSVKSSVPKTQVKNYEKEVERVRENIKRAKPLMIHSSR